MTLLNVTGLDVEFETIKLHNPSILEISEKIEDENDFLFALKFITSSLTETMNFLENKELTNFDIFLGILLSQNDESLRIQMIQQGFTYEKMRAIMNLLQILFLDYNIALSQSEIILNKDDNFVILNSENFDELQTKIKFMFKTSFLFNDSGDADSQYNPATEEAKKILDKLNKSKRKIAELNKKEYHTALIENYIIILSIGLKMTPKELNNLSLYQIVTLYERFKMKVSWDLDIKCRLAGGSPEEHPENWMSIL